MQFAGDDRIFIGLGTNLGDCGGNLKQARRLLREYFQAELTVSAIYRSEPVELPDQPWFYNQVVYLRPQGNWLPISILRVLKEIEKAVGREPGIRYGPRILDLDLLLFRDWVFESEEITVPHPKIEQRSFVLQPLAEIAPDVINPKTGHLLTRIWEEEKDLLPTPPLAFISAS